MRRTSGCNPCGAMFGGGIALLIGIIFVGVSWGDISDYLDSQNWVESRGGVYNNDIEVSYDSEDNSETYRARIYYFYMVGDERYEGDRVKFGDDIYTGSRSAAQNVLDKYPIEAQITVYYNPDQPENVVIERSVTNAMMVFAGIGALLALGGFVAIVASPILMLLGRFTS